MCPLLGGLLQASGLALPKVKSLPLAAPPRGPSRLQLSEGPCDARDGAYGSAPELPSPPCEPARVCAQVCVSAPPLPLPGCQAPGPLSVCHCVTLHMCMCTRVTVHMAHTVRGKVSHPFWQWHRHPYAVTTTLSRAEGPRPQSRCEDGAHPGPECQRHFS